MAQVLELFHPLIQDWFTRKYSAPTDIQEKGWREIASRSHVLMTAPTGSGKTLASFLWSINQLVTEQWPGGTVRVLYISPLKALNNDVRRNLTEPLKELRAFFEERGESFPEIRVQTRSGDTSGSDRQKMMRRPPEILITTPESLNIMLTSGAAQSLLSGLSVLILDEIHAIAANKRGVHLFSAVERLTLINGEFQRIGLSATVQPMNLVASLLGGYYRRYHKEEASRPRDVKILRSEIRKKYELSVAFPDTPEGEGSQWPSTIAVFAGKIRSNRSTLIFSNSRRQTEKVTRMINEYMGETVAFAHHGSLSREIRHFVEQKMKAGELKAIVATSSLEMGIDIGSIDEVLLIQAPFSLSSAIQRIGRGGHNVGDVSRSTIFPMFGLDLVSCAITAEAVLAGEIEALKIPENPLDVLAQVILSMCCTEEWNLDELYLFITSVYHWRNLPRRHFDLVLNMLNGRYSDTRIGELKARLNIDRAAGTARARDGAERVIYMSGGTIPDRGYYELRLMGDGSKIGELDEEFVWERNPGDFFTLGTQTWRIDRIGDRAVEVSPGDSNGAMSPFWKADPNGRDFFYSLRILDLLDHVERKWNDPRLGDELSRRFHMSPEAAESMLFFLERQKDVTGASLPGRNNLVIEHFNDPLNRTDCHQVILHTLWGGTLNYPYSEALSQAWEDKHGYPLQVFCDDDAVILDLPHQFSSEDVLSLVNADNLESLLRRRLESTMFFGGRFRHNCSRALLLPRKSFKQRTPLWLTRLRSKKLLQAVSRYEDFPILTETWRSCLRDDFDLPSLAMVLDEIREGKIRITDVVTRTPSPFAAGIIYDHTNQRMYEDDTPLGGQSNLNEDLIRGIVHESGLRPMLSCELVAEFQAKLTRTFPDYCPGASDDLFDWIEERIFLPLSQWEELTEALIRDRENCAEILEDVKNRIVLRESGDSSEPIVLSVTYDKKFDADKFIGEIDDVLPQWLSFFGPVLLTRIAELYPAPSQIIMDCLEELRQSDQLIIDRLTEGAVEDEICTAENLEILFRLKRRKGRKEFKALPAESLQLFLAQQQLLTGSGGDKDDLRDVMERLIAFGAKAPLWEKEILPARLNPYYRTWLDTLFQESPLMWYGCGKETIAFCFDEEQSLFIPPRKGKKGGEDLLPDSRGGFTFWDIKEHSGKNSTELVESLWKLCWKGAISNDHFSTVRSGIANKYNADSFSDMEKERGGRKISRGGYSRWVRSRPVEGRWFIPETIGKDEDLIARDERLREVIRQLFLRYGVLFRQLLERETEQLNWNAVFPTLRLMELSGECVAGYFFEGVRGLQFASWEALRMLKDPLEQDTLYWMNCTDPASLAGIRLDELKGKYPKRMPSNHMVFRGQNPLLYSLKNGKELEFFTEPDHPDSLESLGFFRTLLSRESEPLKSIKVEKVNGLAVSESPFRKVLKEAGFRDNFNCYILSGVRI
ncbi:DEAD/DEAH box helicase [Spirochaeta isovalerica]|uniref:ATP-dependent Lhr-like helicase n=1 Tax=Spirochaeta isovalerica TaxID=150 RepID=A0A841R9F0_9SPIO|nr:DEAD/DEAH box helicase [Spirochaeta isovalerica]MBB6479837.1 ATP-dependent Lhr-like helicase [Spirochaeta isovalerica]